MIAALLKGTVKDIRLGEHLTAVINHVDRLFNCGLSSNPVQPKTLTYEVCDELTEITQSSPGQDLYNLTFRPDLRLASIWVATINALQSHDPESWVDSNAVVRL